MTSQSEKYLDLGMPIVILDRKMFFSGIVLGSLKCSASPVYSRNARPNPVQSTFPNDPGGGLVLTAPS